MPIIVADQPGRYIPAAMADPADRPEILTVERLA